MAMRVDVPFDLQEGFAAQHFDYEQQGCIEPVGLCIPGLVLSLGVVQADGACPSQCAKLEL
jgi:hypothetical protein